ncbi:MAG: heparinase II/III family protein [Rikenellaceae bacterium]
MTKLKSILFTLTILLLATTASSKTEVFNTPRPRLLLTQEGVENIKASLGTLPDFDASLEEIRVGADKALVTPIDVPIPVDGGGGYTHEQHKQNYYDMYHCGIMYQITGEAKYAEHVKDVLYEYSKMYSTLPPHPDPKSECKGRIFWQSLNEYVWLVHVANAYDCVYEYFTPEQRKHVEDLVFRPMIEFLSNSDEAHVYGFNRMHNHGTWATTAVGMMGFIMNDKDLVEKALYGSEKDRNGGFLSQIDYLFSPDGYFTEGAYYQRYALWPFMVFAQVLEHNMPDVDIYNYRNGTLKKATDVLIQQAYNRDLMKYNDAMEKSLDAQEIVNAVDATYKADPSNKELLSIAADQRKYVVSDAGLITARAVANGEAREFKYRSQLFRDGSDGTQGGLAILRTKGETDGMTLLFRATSHGLSHGHYDKLGIAIHDNGYEVLPDYGSSRFLNLEPKYGGQYTLENYTFAKQTIAHNTVIVDQTSHFKGDIDTSSKYAPSINFFGDSDQGDKKGVQIISAHDIYATPGVVMNRTLAMIETGADPLIIDIFRVNSDTEHTYDLPFYYTEQLVESDFTLRRNTDKLVPFGTDYGYQHLWLEAEGEMVDDDKLATFTWYKDNRFYSVNTVADQKSKFYQVRTGANDPDQNLHLGIGIVLREQAQNHTFVSTIESHGLYDLLKEITVGYKSNVDNIEVIVDNTQHSVVVVTMKSGVQYTLCVQNEGSQEEEDKENVAKASNGKVYTWTGDYALFTKQATK